MALVRAVEPRFLFLCAYIVGWVARSSKECCSLQPKPLVLGHARERICSLAEEHLCLVSVHSKRPKRFEQAEAGGELTECDANTYCQSPAGGPNTVCTSFDNMLVLTILVIYA